MLESDFLTNYFMRRVYFSSDDEDLALVRQSLAGQTEAFGGLVTRYQRVMYTVALRMLGNQEDALRDKGDNVADNVAAGNMTEGQGNKAVNAM